MTHYMNLWDDSFCAIKEGWKTIEMRLNDEKRSIIKVGDSIEFTNTTSQEKMLCIVLNLFHYPDFAELYKNHDKISIGYKEEEKADPNDMRKYYTTEQIEKYGVVGIELIKKKEVSIMKDYGEEAKRLHREGNRCAASVYKAFEDVNNNSDGQIPLPRSEDGKCGAVIAAEKLIREMGLGDTAGFDEEFTKAYGSLKCAELIKQHGRRCNEFVGFAAKYVESLLPKK